MSTITQLVIKIIIEMKIQVVRPSTLPPNQMVSLPYPQLDGHNPYSPGRASFMPESVRIDLGHNLPSLPWERGESVTASPQNESPGSY